MLLNDKSDTAQLLGCFEQTQSDISAILADIDRIKDQSTDAQLVADICTLEYSLAKNQNEPLKELQNLKDFLVGIRENPNHAILEQKVHEIERLIKKGGSSKFEWVDSVLVRSIVQGEWAVFENANLCNPSILDRLNPLLEEGNTSLCINEQGLVEGDQLRDIKAHPDFRSIFVISQRTLVDQGKDVSRALRNRCLCINISYSAQGEPLPSAKVLDTQLTQFRIDTQPLSDTISNA